jgi:hypothetical protein
VKLLANMTEFGRTPFFTAAEFEAMGYRMVIWPVSALTRRQQGAEQGLRSLRRDGGAPEHDRRDADPRRALQDHRLPRVRSARRLDRRTVVPQGMPQRCHKRMRPASVRAPRSEPERRQIRGAAVEVGRVLEGLAELEHVALGIGLADDLDAERQAAATGPPAWREPQRPR